MVCHYSDILSVAKCGFYSRRETQQKIIMSFDWKKVTCKRCLRYKIGKE